MRHVVALDAMGGDHAPAEVVAGAADAARELEVHLLLFGREEEVAPLVPRDVADLIEVVHATEVIPMDDDPARSVRRKKDSSLVRAAEAVRDGRAVAMVSAGNTGAAMASALLRMGRIRGVARPAIASFIPVPGGTPTVMLDAGATVDCSPEWLVSFARMGAEMARVRLGIPEPRVGLLCNGEEAGKGDTLRRATAELLAGMPGFIGNVEGHDVLSDRVDVVVTDGFVGNVALKSMEGTATLFRGLIERVLSSSDASPDLWKAFDEALDEVDSDSTGGAMLLGVDGVCVISHGASSARAIVNAIRVAAECHQAGIVDRLKKVMGHAG